VIHPDKSAHDVLTRLVRKLQKCARGFDKDERALFDRILLEFWLSTQSEGPSLLEEKGKERVLEDLRAWCEEVGLPGDDEDDTKGEGEEDTTVTWTGTGTTVH